jgi:hypothetical protein
MDADLWGFQCAGVPWPEVEELPAGPLGPSGRCTCELALQPWYQLAERFHAPRPGFLARYLAHRLERDDEYSHDRKPRLADALGRELMRPFRARHAR